MRKIGNCNMVLGYGVGSTISNTFCVILYASLSGFAEGITFCGSMPVVHCGFFAQRRQLSGKRVVMSCILS